jgi:hypothetical protein
MLKKIALMTLFAITLSIGTAAGAATRSTAKHAPTAPAPQGFCPMGFCA